MEIAISGMEREKSHAAVLPSFSLFRLFRTRREPVCRQCHLSQINQEPPGYRPNRPVSRADHLFYFGIFGENCLPMHFSGEIGRVLLLSSFKDAFRVGIEKFNLIRDWYPFCHPPFRFRPIFSESLIAPQQASWDHGVRNLSTNTEVEREREGGGEGGEGLLSAGLWKALLWMQVRCVVSRWHEVSHMKVTQRFIRMREFY